jgi:hypothetical protein
LLEYASEERADPAPAGGLGGEDLRVVGGGAGIRGAVKFDCSASASSSEKGLDSIHRGGVMFMD